MIYIDICYQTLFRDIVQIFDGSILLKTILI